MTYRLRNLQSYLQSQKLHFYCWLSLSTAVVFNLCVATSMDAKMGRGMAKVANYCSPSLSIHTIYIVFSSEVCYSSSQVCCSTMHIGTNHIWHIVSSTSLPHNRTRASRISQSVIFLHCVQLHPISETRPKRIQHRNIFRTLQCYKTQKCERR